MAFLDSICLCHFGVLGPDAEDSENFRPKLEQDDMWLPRQDDVLKCGNDQYVSIEAESGEATHVIVLSRLGHMSSRVSRFVME